MYNILSKTTFLLESEEEKEKRKRNMIVNMLGTLANYARLGINSNKSDDFLIIYDRVSDYLDWTDKDFKKAGFTQPEINKAKMELNKIKSSKSKIDQAVEKYGSIKRSEDVDRKQSRKAKSSNGIPIDREAMIAAKRDDLKDKGIDVSDDLPRSPLNPIVPEKINPRNVTTLADKKALQKEKDNKEAEKKRKKEETEKRRIEAEEKKKAEREAKKSGVKEKEPERHSSREIKIRRLTPKSEFDKRKEEEEAKRKKEEEIQRKSNEAKKMYDEKLAKKKEEEEAKRKKEEEEAKRKQDEKLAKEAHEIIRKAEAQLLKTEQGKTAIGDVVVASEAAVKSATEVKNVLISPKPPTEATKKSADVERVNKKMIKSLDELPDFQRKIVEKVLSTADETDRQRQFNSIINGLNRRGIVLNPKLIKASLKQARDAHSVNVNEKTEEIRKKTEDIKISAAKTSEELSNVNKTISGLESTMSGIQKETKSIEENIKKQGEVYDENISSVIVEIKKLQSTADQVDSMKKSLETLIETVKKKKEVTPESEKIIAEETKKLQKKTEELESMHKKVEKMQEELKKKADTESQEALKLRIKLAEIHADKDNHELNLKLEKERAKNLEDNLKWQEEVRKKLDEVHEMEKKLAQEREQVLKDELEKTKQDKRRKGNIVKFILIGIAVLFLAVGGYYIYRYIKNVRKKKAQISFLLMHEKDPVKRSYLEYKLQQLTFKEVDLEYQSTVLKLKAIYKYEGSKASEKNELLVNTNSALTTSDIRDLEKIYLN